MINNRYVLTAAHCIDVKALRPRWSLTSVRLGEWNTESDTDCDESFINDKVCNDPPIDVAIERKILHESYNAKDKSNRNDIGLLRLAESVTYSNFIRPICLPIDESLRNFNFVGKTLSVSGWGELEIFN